ncbi:hypothetical protein GS597_15260 [Synechococcales cyanobacterium C]|uniref:Uncharacterized protein n=1 Tax=Petrachloros mirabilis ULC683 TaxID=2781853 RepID=A0A8K2A1C3_9CYAN|nr:hypothetical protein [Petrachloros mirabilis]NCJ07841.1 hypothetical protein [Petrachloros mirabilis ULC683]
MTHPDPSNPADQAPETIDVSAKAMETRSDGTFTLPQDDDRLYTDEFIRDNENASRQLLISFVTFFVVGLGAMIWFLVTQNSPEPIEEPIEPPPPPTDLQPLPPSLPNDDQLPAQPGFPLPEPPLSPGVPDQLPDTGEDVPAFPVPEGVQPDFEPNFEPNFEEEPEEFDPNFEGEGGQTP